MLPKNFFRNPFEHHVIFGFVVLLFVVFSSAFANAETLTWTKNNGGSGSWHDDTNWNPPQVPTNGDDVSIPVGTDPVLYSTGTTILNSLSCSGSLTISYGILNLSSASSIGTGGTLNLSGGSLGGSGDVTVSGDFTWTSGTLTGGGDVTTSGVSNIGGFITLDGRKLINTGTATWGNIYFYFQNNAEIDNRSDITMDSDSALNLGYVGYISGSFTNTGTVTISGGAGTAQFNIPLSNSGTVDIISGTLRLNTDSTHTGTSNVTVTSGNKFYFAGGVHSFATGATLAGGGELSVFSGTVSFTDPISFAGSVVVSSGAISFNGGADLTTVNLSGGSLGGSGDVTVSGDFTWTSGTLTGGGDVTTSGVSNIGGFITLDGRKLINTGTATWGNIYFYFQNNAEIDNRSDITMDSDSALNLGYVGYISGSFTNTGTVTISGGAGTAQFNIPLSNSGTVDIISGTLRLNTDSTHTGTSNVTVTSGNKFYFAGGVHSFATGATLAGGGELSVFSGTVSFTDPISFAGSVVVSSGAISFNGGADLTTVNLSGGSLGGSGDVTVSGDFTWTSGTLTGGGDVTTSGVSNIGGFITLDGRKLINTGTATWGNIYFYFQNNAEIDNRSDITMDSDSALNLGYVGYISGSFTNTGTVTISGGAGTAQFNIPLSNSGTVDIISGTLRLNTDSTHTGTSNVTVTSGNKFYFAGGVHSFATGATLAGGGELSVFSGTVSFTDPISFAGSVVVSSGAISFNGGADLTTVNLFGGSLGGSGDVTVSGDFTWTSGTLTGGGDVTTSGVSNIGGFITLDGRKLINTGTATWGNIYFYFQNNAEIDNRSDITMDSDSALNLGYVGYISGSFTNTGTVTISGGAGTAQFNIPLSNSGTVDIISGTLRLTTNTTNNGTIQGSGTLYVIGIEFTNAGNINPGTSSGILTINGNFQQSSIGALNTEIAGTDGSDYDQLNISGNLNLSGILNLSLIEDFLPVDSNSFTIVTFSSLNGLFTQINWPALNPGLAWEYRALATNIQLYCGIDTDRDGLTDTLENTVCTDTNDADTDDDALLDGQEDLNKNGQREPWETDPCDEDTDNDTMPDGWEADHGLDPLDPSDCGDDPDEDNLDNCEEYLHDTDPNNADSDADGMPDGWEVDNNFDPLVDDALEDADQDGYSNLREYLSDSDPWDDQDLPPLIADVDSDNDCDGYDLAMFMLEYGRHDCDTIPCDYDLDLDGDVGEIDLFLFSEDFGSITAP